MSVQSNPFVVQTPEDISALDATSLFVDVFSDYHNVPNVGHTFLHGPRGSGKSMMFRFLEPDCQMIDTGKPLSDLAFYGVYIPIKNTDLKLTEFRRLEDKHANGLLNEHFLVIYMAIKIIKSLQTRATVPNTAENTDALQKFYYGEFNDLLVASGWKGTLPTVEPRGGVNACLACIIRVLSGLYSTVLSYLRQIAFVQRSLRFTAALCGFLDFLVPLVRYITTLRFMPKCPIFLLIDDADNLNYIQTTILNSWVSCRTSAYLSLKISTQLAYKTYRTATGQTIDTPHDYSEVYISSVYTAPKSMDRYYERVKAIVNKRLVLHHIDATPETFFPPDKEQEDEIKRIARRLIEEWPSSGRGFRATDDSYRYAIPDYIASLSGTRKAGSTYSYSGFSQLVHLSSGIIRYFLDAASRMYGETLSRADETLVNAIPAGVQNRVAREQAYEFLSREFDKLLDDEEIDPKTLDRTHKLRNLIHALGGTFHQILISKAAERRVFSIALSDLPDTQVKEVLRLGVQYGYFHESTIGNKEGTGRTKLYVLSRRLAPFFELDPNGFAGYKFVTSDLLLGAMSRPKSFVGRIRSLGVENVLSADQLTLFDDEEVGDDVN